MPPGSRACGAPRGRTGDEGASPLLVSPESLAELWDLDRRKAREPGARTGGIVREHCPAILKACGCGTVTAAELLVSAGENPERLEKGESPFARHCGVAPIPAPACKTTGRTGPDRGGDRTANKALHQIVLSGLSHDEDTKDYVKRRMRGGNGQRPLSKREAIRCPRRYVAREVYWAITHPFGEPQARRGEASGQSLREARLIAGMTQREAAAAVGTGASTLSKIESGKISGRSKAARRYASWVNDGMPVDSEEPAA